MIVEDFRTRSIRSWLNNELHMQIININVASSDASFRRYFRITHQHKNYIVMDAPPAKEDVRPFIKVAKILAKSSVNVPEIYQHNLAQGFLLLEDFGSLCFLDVLDLDNADSLYQKALDSLFKLQHNINIINSHLPEYTEQLLNKELGIFEQWFLNRCCGLNISAQEQGMLDKTWTILVESALHQPQVFVHRDYHSRNLMQVSKNNPGIIDFQDAVIGPVTYDLVSLLRDCYIKWPKAKVDSWLKKHFQRLQKAGLIDCNYTIFLRWFDLMGMQRHLKAIGIFSRLQLRDAKPDYLKDIPRTLYYVTEVCSQYPELAAFKKFLEQQILPVERFIT